MGISDPNVLDGARPRLSRLRKGEAAYGLDCNPWADGEELILRAIASERNVAHKIFRIVFSSEIQESGEDCLKITTK